MPRTWWRIFAAILMPSARVTNFPPGRPVPQEHRESALASPLERVGPIDSDDQTVKCTQSRPAEDDIPVTNTRCMHHHFRASLGTFGFVGAPLLFVICASITWTTWLIVFNIDPNATANYLMDTVEFDDGASWLIIDPDPAFLALTCVGLGAVLLGYLYAFAKMTLWRHWGRAKPPSDGSRSLVSSVTRKVFSEHTITTWNTLTGYNGANRKLWNTWLKVVNLAFQLVTLHQTLEAGFPASLCYSYSVLIATNCLSCVFVIMNHTRLSAFGEILIDTVFDMLTALGAPIYLLVHSYYNFHFDREAFRIILEFAAPSAFERRARMSADPVQVTQFLINLNALRITTALDVILCIGMNLSFAYRLKTPKTYDEWINPPDATETVRALAASGDLQVLQVINRKLVQLSEELHRCTNLRHMYVSSDLFIESIPAWAKDFEKLEFLNIEGKPEATNLISISGDLLTKMSSLTYFHLGLHLHLTRLPSFGHLGKLKSLSIAVLTSLQSVPSVKFLRSLERLQLLFLISVRTAPDLGYLSHLFTFQMGDAPACCNGNLGKYDKTAPVCKQATCAASDEIGDDPGRDRLFERFNKSFCSWYTPSLDPYTSGPTKERIDMCEGVLYRKCVVPGAANGTAAMCFSNRMQAIACNIPVNHNIEIQKKQILQKVEIPCDPVEEAWLGCTAD